MKNILINNAELEKLKKRNFIIEAGQVSNNVYYIKSGVVRHYVIDLNGNEKTIRLSKENDFFYSSIVSFFTNEPTYIFCQALTDLELLVWSKEKLEHLSLEYPKIISFINDKLIEFIIQKHKKEIALLTKEASERLKEFNIENKKLFNRIPHHIIASFLNISPETLSRLRLKNKSKS